MSPSRRKDTPVIDVSQLGRELGQTLQDVILGLPVDQPLRTVSALWSTASGRRCSPWLMSS